MLSPRGERVAFEVYELVIHSFAYQDCRKNPKCTKTLGGLGFAPDPNGGAYTYTV